MLPVMLNLTGRVVVVVGGGSVGLRKAATAREAGASLRLIDPHPSDLGALACNVTWVAEAYRADHLDGASLVFACAPADVNARVVADATAQGVWVNSASDPGQGDCVLPAVVRRGGLTLAVSTGGASPALARRICEKLESEFDDPYVEWVRLLQEVRNDVLALVSDSVQRHHLLSALADWPWLDRIRVEGIDAVRAAMREEIHRVAGS